MVVKQLEGDLARTVRFLLRTHGQELI